MRTTPRTAAIFLAPAFALIGAASHATAGPEQRTLAGTTWQLTSIQSSDDDQGSTPVPDPSKFTVEFAQDGQAFFQIDCNRGRGGYTAAAGDDGQSGSLTFSPIATTMMMCPQPSLDQQVGRALAGVRSYLFDGDQLHMALLADSGTLTWQRP